MSVLAPLILTVGIPGSGKSTWAEQLAAQKVIEDKHYLIISTDGIRAQLYGDAAIQGEWTDIRRSLTHQLKAARHSIDQGCTAAVIYDATNAARRQRREFIRLARRCRYTLLVAAWIDTPLAVCLQRNAARSRQVPPHIIEKMHRQLTGFPPAEAEGLDRIIRIQTGTLLERK
ncbi:MAG: AAA family ATPase [Phormidesmis sp.]